MTAVLALLALLVPGLPDYDRPPPPPAMTPAAELALIRSLPGPSSEVAEPEGALAAQPEDAARDAAPAAPYDVVWDRLADCESGDWLDGGAAFVPGSARWRWAAPGTDLPPWGTAIHHGGLQFLPATWTWVAGDVLDDPPTFAYDATPAEQVAVAEEVLARQGWGAWPVCSRLLGLR